MNKYTRLFLKELVPFSREQQASGKSIAGVEDVIEKYKALAKSAEGYYETLKSLASVKSKIVPTDDRVGFDYKLEDTIEFTFNPKRIIIQRSKAEEIKNYYSDKTSKILKDFVKSLKAEKEVMASEMVVKHDYDFKKFKLLYIRASTGPMRLELDGEEWGVWLAVYTTVLKDNNTESIPVNFKVKGVVMDLKLTLYKVKGNL